ncbi:hypothetical protein Tco_1017664 [Tanacetum coccineum]|uniref:Uncharacterized protein n=1 Tax=Tanacetum coccineum TaxID=301880 RepID=A0ABQ5FT83_9ASTR
MTTLCRINHFFLEEETTNHRMREKTLVMDSWKKHKGTLDNDDYNHMLKEYVELTPAEADQADCEIKAINSILQGLPTEIKALVRQHRGGKDPMGED